MDVIELDYKEKVLETKTLFDAQCEVSVEYYWDSHGRRIPWKTNKSYPKYRKSAKVVITEEKYQWNLANGEWNDDKRWVLTIDGVKVAGDPFSYKGTTDSIRIKVDIGHG